MEIDRLMQNSAKQKRKIAELDSKFVSNQFNDDFPEMSEVIIFILITVNKIAVLS